jgi:hypothetical protein
MTRCYFLFWERTTLKKFNFIKISKKIKLHKKVKQTTINLLKKIDPIGNLYFIIILLKKLKKNDLKKTDKRRVYR